MTLEQHVWRASDHSVSNLCTAMVMRDGGGDECGLDRDDPVHSGIERSDREPGSDVRKLLEAAGTGYVLVDVAAEKQAKWDARAATVARAVAGWSSCMRDQVGAVVMTQDHDVVATGFNDTPSGELNCGDGGCSRALKGKIDMWGQDGRWEDYPEVWSGDVQAADESCVHAEANAILRAGIRARGAVLVVTREPCGACALLIRSAGIVRVVVCGR